MKKLLLSISILASLAGNAQIIDDSASIGAGYANHTWYSLENGEVWTSSKTSWDLAFEISGFNGSILLNHVNGNTLWLYPNGDTSSWSSIDTTGLSSWSPLYNSDTSWAYGAFNVGINSADPYDLGWGVYNMTTHYVVGDSIYVLRNSNGDFKKLWIEKLAGGVYSFKTADLDGSNEENHSLTKSEYTGKNFGYYDLSTSTSLDIEPLSADWDLLFTQYAALIPGYGGYPSTGVLLNAGVKAAKIYPIAEPETFTAIEGLSLNSEINTIGYNWKSYAFATNSWEIADSTAYIIQTANGDYWRVIMTGFGGSVTGNYYFNKEKLASASDSSNSVAEIGTPNLFQVYPNPSAGQMQLAYDFSNLNNAALSLYNMNGALVQTIAVQNSGLQVQSIDLSSFSKGIYFLNLQSTEGQHIQKLIIQ